MLRALFGTGHADPNAFSTLVERYHAILAAGAKAGRYAASPRRPPRDLGSWQRRLISRCQSAVESLARVLATWSEPDLDRCRLPHPLLGNISVREMVYFTLVHFEHHRSGVVKRLREAAPRSN